MRIQAAQDYGELGKINWKSFNLSELFDFNEALKQVNRSRPQSGQVPTGSWVSGDETNEFDRVRIAVEARLRSLGEE